MSAWLAVGFICVCEKLIYVLRTLHREADDD